MHNWISASAELAIDSGATKPTRQVNKSSRILLTEAAQRTLSESAAKPSSAMSRSLCANTLKSPAGSGSSGPREQGGITVTHRLQNEKIPGKTWHIFHSFVVHADWQ